MVKGFVIVRPHRRKGKMVKGHRRLHRFNRGNIRNIKRFTGVNKTIAIRDRAGLFIGRENVGGRGDFTGIRREAEGRIVGRTRRNI